MATLFLNQIFYPDNKFDTLRCLEPYMLNEHIIQNRPSKKIENAFSILDDDEKRRVCIEPEKENECLPPSYVFSPRNTDTLFWCAYVLHHGEAEYNMIGRKFKTIEIQEKQYILEHLSKNRENIKSILKTLDYKWSNVRFQETQSELMLNKKTSWASFHAMCIFYKLNAILVQDNIYLEFRTNETDPCYKFTRNVDGFVSVNTTPMIISEYHHIKNTKFRFNYGQDKLLKGISTYKIPELEEIARKVGVILQLEKPKKTDWYNGIIEKLNQTKLI